MSGKEEGKRDRKGRKPVKGRVMSCSHLDQLEACCGPSKRRME